MSGGGVSRGRCRHGMSECKTDERRIEKCNYIFQNFVFIFFSRCFDFSSTISMKSYITPENAAFTPEWRRRFFRHIHISFSYFIFLSRTGRLRICDERSALVSFANQYSVEKKTWMRTMWNAAVNRNIHIKNVHFFPNIRISIELEAGYIIAERLKQKKTHWSRTLFRPLGGRHFFLCHISFIRFAMPFLPCVHLRRLLIFISVSMRLVLELHSNAFVRIEWKASNKKKNRIKNRTENGNQIINRNFSNVEFLRGENHFSCDIYFSSFPSHSAAFLWSSHMQIACNM